MPVSTTQPAVDITVRPFNFGSFQNVATTTGTDITPPSTTMYYSSIYLPGSCAVTGVKILLGSASTNGNVLVGLYDLAGNLLASSAATATGTAATTQSVPFANGAVPIGGPRHVLVGLIFSSTSDRFRAIPAVFDAGSNPMTGSVTVTANTLPATFQPSATTFTADKGPICSVY